MSKEASSVIVAEILEVKSKTEIKTKYGHKGIDVVYTSKVKILSVNKGPDIKARY